MSAVDVAGWFAASLTTLTFFCRDMRRLRVLALCANGAFIAYGSMAALTPVLVLHLLLAPVNAWRLLEMRSRAIVDRADAAPVAPPGRTALAAKVPGRRAIELRRWTVGRQLAGCASGLRRRAIGSVSLCRFPSRPAIANGHGRYRRRLRTQGGFAGRMHRELPG